MRHDPSKSMPKPIKSMIRARKAKMKRAPTKRRKKKKDGGKKPKKKAR